MTTVSLLLYYANEDDKKKIVYDVYTYTRDMVGKPIIDFNDLKDKEKDKFYLLRIRDEYNSYKPLWDYFLERGHKMAIYVDPDLMILTPSFSKIDYKGFIDDNESPYTSDDDHHHPPPGFDKKKVNLLDLGYQTYYGQYRHQLMGKLVPSEYGMRIDRWVDLNKKHEEGNTEHVGM